MINPAPRSMLVGLEDRATAGVVATAAAHLAMAQDATALIVLHVLDTHMVAGGLLGLAGDLAPVVETEDDQEALLALAEAAIRAEYDALDRPVPAITRVVRAGALAAILAQVAEESGAAAIVVGARRPHAFGRHVHPDVRASLAACTTVPIYVVPLQAEGPG
jgi:nucleotide-binding universal stress UspA family protein